MAASPDDLAQTRVDALDRVGRVDHPPHRRRRREEHNDKRPGPTSEGGQARELNVPVLCLKACRAAADCRVDWPDRRKRSTVPY